MINNINYKLFFLSGFILLILDLSYLYINQEWYKKEIFRSQGSELKLKWLGVFVRYLSQIIGLNLFVLQNHGPILYSFLFGLIIYSNYIGTNYATFEIFDEKLAIVDLIKGGLIMSLTTYLSYQILHIK